MADISYGKLWRSEFHNNVFAKDRVQDINLNQLKLKVNDSYMKNEKIANYATSIDGDVVNKAYLDTDISEVEDHISYIEKDMMNLGILNDSMRRFYLKGL